MSYPHSKSPNFTGRLYRLFLEEQKLNQFSSDIDEIYQQVLNEKGRIPALIWYWSQLLISFPPVFFRTLKWRCIMFNNYIKIAIRNIFKHRGYSFINVAGLAVGMACCILILAFIVDELSYDRFHEKADRLFRVATYGKVSGRIIEVATVPSPMGPALINDYPEVLDAVRFRPVGTMMVQYEDKKFSETDMMYTDQSFFNIFSFPLISGNPETALEAPYSIVLTRDVARRYFGEDDPVGKTLKLNNTEEYRVTGIITDPPAQSHIQYNILMSYQTLITRDPSTNIWANWNYQTYIELAEDVDYKEFEKKFEAFNEKYIGALMKAISGEVQNYLQPLTSIHLHSKLEAEIGVNGDIRYIYAFAAIAIFILVIACINFMNLSTARSANRAKEVGLRKVVGAERNSLVYQFLGESILLALISLVFALILVSLFLPHFNNLAARELDITFLFQPWLLLGFLSIVVFVGLFAGSYPAFFLSGFRPVSVLKGGLQKGVKSGRFRSVLVVFQFSISIMLLIGTGIVLNQLNFMRTKKLGFNKEQMLVMNLRDDETQDKLRILKTELKNIEGVVNVAGSMKVPGQDFFNTSIFFPEGFSADQSFLMENFYICDDFIETYDIEIVSGRGFSSEISTDVREACLINETAASALEWDEPVGKIIYVGNSVEDFNARSARTVVGVLKNFHHRSVQHRVEPLILDLRRESASRLTIRLRTDNIIESMKAIEEKWNEIAVHHPFEYFFLDEYFNDLYRGEERLGNIFQAFTVFAIFIGCLGLFGLVSFAAEQRTKEIGIRKVLGSSVGSIILILCREFLLLVAIANILAWPVAYFTMKNWLRSFPYQSDIGIITFLTAGIMAVVIALLTVSYRAYRAAVTNPVDALRYE